MAKIYSITEWQDAELVPTDALEYWHALQTGATGNDIVYDYSGNDRHIAAASDEPTLQADVLNGHLGMYFDGTNNPLKNDTDDITLNHIFILASFEDAAFAGNEGLLSDTGTLPVLLGNGAASVKFFNNSYTGTYRKNDEVFAASNMQAPMSGSFALIEIVLQPGLPFEGWQIGQDRNNAARKWKGWFIEDLAYSRVLTLAERRRVLLYFCLKFHAHNLGVPLWFPSSDLTNILYHHFDDKPAAWEEITEDFTYADKAKDFNEVSDEAPLRWVIQHLRRLRERVIIFDAFWNAARLVNPFFFRDKYGVDWSGLHIEDYSRAHEAHKSWKKDAIFNLIKYPYSDETFPTEIDYDLTPPTVPTLAVFVNSSTQLDLTWTTTTDDTAVDHIEMRFSVGGSGYGSPVSIGADDGFYSHTGLTPDTVYTYQVRSVDTAGNASAWSNAAQETTPEPEPVLVRAVDCGRTSGGTVDGWEQDTIGAGGGTSPYGGTIDITALTDPAPQDVYQTVYYTTGTPFSFNFTGLTPSGNYRLRFHFSAPAGESAAYNFDVTVNGVTALDDYSIPTAAGGSGKGSIEEYDTTANGSGQLNCSFALNNTMAKVAGIEIYSLD